MSIDSCDLYRCARYVLKAGIITYMSCHNAVNVVNPRYSQTSLTSLSINNTCNPFIHSFILAISIVPIQVLYYSEAVPTTARILYWSFTAKRTCWQL